MSTTRLHLNRFHLFGLIMVGCLLLALGLPGATPTRAAGNGEDYATNELGNPWDMDGPGDMAYEQTRDGDHLSNITFTNGIFSATATNGDPRLFLRWPVDSHVNPVPQDGNYHPIDANKYKFFTVRVNVTSTQFAQVLWVPAVGVAPGSTGFRQLQAGWNIVTFDLTAGTSGTPWSGSIQGLMFDPMNATGAFQIDYVRLSTVDPSSPNNIPPQLAITSPSFISGPDYATTVVSNPWDMNDSADLKGINVTGASFGSGIYNATNTSGDAALMLNVTTPIDTSRFKYVTYRMQVDGQKDTTLGSVARFFWWTTIPEQASVTNDNVVYEGFQTVSFDLTKIKLENVSPLTWAASNPKVFRLDPHEFPTPRAFHVDYVMLTGDMTAGNSFDIRYQASDGDGAAPVPQFFFDNNASGFDGTAITCSANAASVAAEGAFKVFLPTIKRESPVPPVSPAGATCTWNTSNVPNGTYYIYGLVNDGTDTAQIYSQTRVVVSH
jgi:hypothetical protein